MNYQKRTRSSNLFLLEMIIAILFFSIASAVCVQIFVKSHLLSRDANDLNHAVNVASSAAQTIYHSSSIQQIDADLINVFGDSSCTYYDSDWSICEKQNALYRMTIELSREKSMAIGTITVDNISNSKNISTIYSIDISHYMQGGAVNE